MEKQLPRDPLTSYVSNTLVSSSYRMTPVERNLLHLTFSHIHREKNPNPNTPMEFTLTAALYAAIFPKYDHGKLHEVLVNATKRLSKRQAVLNYGTEHQIIMNWIDFIEYKRGNIRIGIGKRIGYYLTGMGMLDNFTKVPLKTLGTLRSEYGSRLFEVLCQYESTGLLRISVDDFKTRLGIQDNYPEYKELKRTVIKRAIADIEKNTSLKINFKEVKEDKNVTALHFVTRYEHQLDIDDIP